MTKKTYLGVGRKRRLIRRWHVDKEILVLQIPISK